MKKIGILTFWGVPNYGAWAQSYALNNVVREVADKDCVVEHIDYLSPVHNDLYYKQNIRLKNAFNYSWSEIPHTRHLNEEDIAREYFDTIITGSDAIWEFTLPEMGDDIHLIGNDLNSPNIISYAASSGVTGANSNVPQYLYEGIRNYKAISVRDENTKELVMHLSNNSVVPDIHLDPVLLWNFKKDTNIKECIYTSYIAVYGTKWSPEFIEYAKEFARKKNCLLISIGDNNKWCDVWMRMIELRTFEWIGMIKNADYVFTSTYHGLLFSIALDKQFKFDMVPYVRNRAVTILEKIGVSTYYGDGATLQEVFGTDLDYVSINEKLGILRKQSIDWLTKSIKR